MSKNRKRLFFKYWLDFLMAMTWKEVNARYKHAFLGFLWVILNPILQMMVIGFVFQFFVPVKVDNYFLFLLSGLLPWNFFSMTVQKATPAFVYERSLIQKSKFPRESIVLSIVFANLFHTLIAIGLLLLFMFFSNQLFWTNLWLLPIAIIWLTINTSSLSLLLGSWNVKYRDVNFMLQAAMPLWFYATPILYSMELIPQSFHFLFNLNPMLAVIELFKYCLVDLNMVSAESIYLSLVSSFLFLWLAIIVFKKESPHFDDWM